MNELEEKANSAFDANGMYLKSIAISLKRIADNLDKLTKVPTMVMPQMTEEEYMKAFNCHPGLAVSHD